MQFSSRRRLMAPFALIALMAGTAGAHAQAWPSKPIKIIVPFPPGGSVDSFGRVFAAKLQDQLKTPVVIDNRGGAGGNVGANMVAKSAPDGYTILLNTNGQAISPAIYKSLPFDPVADFIRVAELTTTSTVIVVNNKLPVKSFQEFVAYAKANPGKMNYGSTGVGNALHLTMEMIKHATGTDIQMVPFTGDAPLFTAMIGGEIQAALVPTTTAKAHIDAGSIRAIAVTTAKRVSTMPTVPTVMEQGLPNFSVTGWLALFAPAGTPRDIVDRLAKESLIAVASKELKEPLNNLTLDAADAGPEAFDKIYLSDVARFKQVVKDANIPMQE
jgi:tripartite-type tricarboxylate transporter receptor subunit TctC